MAIKRICKVAYCHFCKDFVDTELVDVTINIVELAPSQKYVKTNNITYDEKKYNETKVKCLSCGHYDVVLNDKDFCDAVEKLVKENQKGIKV